MKCPRCNGTGQIEYSFGSMIRDRRLQLGMTQEDLAKLIGVNNTTIHYYETDTRKPSFDVERLLIVALGGEISISFDGGPTE
jgi:transcriptional regulator with XRE-family HTH domain